MLSDEQKQQLRQEKKEKIIRIRKTLSEMTEEQRQAVADKFGIVTVEGHLLTPHNQCFLVLKVKLIIQSLAGFNSGRKPEESFAKVNTAF
jgi:hypothetical protein